MIVDPPASALTDAAQLAALEVALDSLAAVPLAHHDLTVPPCPGWTVADLLDHTTRIHQWATERIGSAPGSRGSFPREEMGTGAALQTTFRRNADGLLAALRPADLDRPAPTFVGDRTVRWWLRRQTQETTVHAWDAAVAQDQAAPIDAALAADGIDEMLDVFFVHRFRAAEFGGTGETMHLHATDDTGPAGGEWLVRFEPEGPVVTREHAKGDVAARGTASDLLLLLWSRVEPATLETFGDVQILERYQAVASY